ncbi:hypothetical protein [Tsukamurella asaccharolytica]|nr:hypothetical protein [Tsukamurella asaccharolytica]
MLPFEQQGIFFLLFAPTPGTESRPIRLVDSIVEVNEFFLTGVVV